MRDAVALVDRYFMAHAERLLRRTATGDSEGDAKAVLKLAQDNGWREFTGRDIQRKSSGRLAEARYRNPALELLLSACLLRFDPRREGNTQGRMQERYVVNPRVFDRGEARG